ncbi:hypothetical protein DSO57_1011949 [Entomophthora muscae]|uniref:Uncharacterized protein n=1 Tax=Entomophthora muscae TaxID=34485 RepID=A0ACC2U587_9FUNG|nr:hypothetical protein DSO57_1011949 [Entomophthora muscae]
MKRKVPMVWLLADQHNLSANPGAVTKKPFDLDEEDPLILETLSNWYKDEILFLDVLLEILGTSLSSTTSIVNPFEINFEYFQQLPNEESIILIPALINFLTKLLTKAAFLEKVLGDIEELHVIHLNCLESLSDVSEKKVVKNPLSS